MRGSNHTVGQDCRDGLLPRWPQHVIVLRLYATLCDPGEEFRRPPASFPDGDKNAAFAIPIFGEHAEVACAEVKFWPKNHDHACVFWHFFDVGDGEVCEQQILPLGVGLHRLELAAVRVEFPVPVDEVELVLLRFGECEDFVRQHDFAFKSEHPPRWHRLPAHLRLEFFHLIPFLHLRHVGCVDELAAPIVVQNDDVLDLGEFILGLQLHCPRVVLLRLHVFDGQLSLRGKFVFAEHLAGVVLHLSEAGEEHDGLHRLGQISQQAPRHFAQVAVVGAHPSPPLEILCAQRIDHHHQREEHGDLDDDVDADFDAANAQFRGCVLGFQIGF